jgi:hypothetical protein
MGHARLHQGDIVACLQIMFNDFSLVDDSSETNIAHVEDGCQGYMLGESQGLVIARFVQQDMHSPGSRTNLTGQGTPCYFWFQRTTRWLRSLLEKRLGCCIEVVKQGLL